MIPRSVSWLAFSAFLGGLLSALVGILVLLNPGYYIFDSPLDLLVALAEGAALLAVLGGLVGLHLAQKDIYGRLGRAGFYMSASGLVMAGVGHLAALPFFVFLDSGGIVYVLIGLSQGVPLVWGAIYVLGTVILSVGFLLLGVATFRAKTLPLWCGPVLILSLAGLWTLGNVFGWISFGLAWILVAHALTKHGKEATGRVA
jgi:hypothetical protein